MKIEKISMVQEHEEASVQFLFELILVAVILVVAALTLGFGAEVLQDQANDLTAGSTERQAVQNGTLAIANLSRRLPTIATVFGISIIVGLLVVYLYGRFVGGQGQK